MHVKINNYLKWLGAFYLMAAAVFIFLSLPAQATDQSDAIAVRVLPNANHDSIETWYAKQGYTGSPQSLTVDGYDAIRDGRTVFINAANLDTTNKKLYTNIYLISYDQDSEENTVDILGQLVSHWKFNNNASDSGTCSISSLNCQADSDCPTDYKCSNTDGAINKGKCILKTEKTCLIDSDCPVNLFCSSLKAKTVRDVKRLGIFNQIKTAIDSYKSTNGGYPSLSSGTYISGDSVSLWPSWKETLWPQLGLGQLLVDPINTLGYCAGYDASTCWSETKNEFVNDNLTLPFGSFAFVYKSTKNGVNYNLCSVFETKLNGYNTTEGWLVSNSCSSGTESNTAPAITSYSADGENNKEFNGYIKAQDLEGDAISWKIVPLSNFSSWSSAPVIKDTGDASQKKIYAAKAGTIGTYYANLVLTDSRGAVSTSKITINIGAANKPKIEADDLNYFVDPINPLTYTFYLEGSNSVPSYTIKPINNSSINIFNGIKGVSSSVGLNRVKIDFSILIPTSVAITDNVAIPFRITATADGLTTTKDVNINLEIEKPYLSFNCDNLARIGQPYQLNGASCLLGSLTSGNHSIKYEIVSGMSGLKIENNTSEGNAYLKADSITVSDPSSSNITIKATNEYGAFSESSFALAANTYCGDGVKQTPNSEKRGGPYNDGNEECDGLDGISTEVSNSPTKQYGCSTGLNVKSPFPILDNSQCVFAAPNTGGGYCGDGYCQVKVNGVPTETGCNCPQDCVNTSCCGDGIVSGDEVCDTGLPDRACTSTNNTGLPSYCSKISIVGTQSCKADCSGWNDCSAGNPDIVSNSSTYCGTTNPTMSGYSCCELTNCVNDACDCCGRYEKDYDWIDLISKASKLGYNYKKVMSPNNGTCTVSSSNPAICTCGAAGCSSAPLCPKSSDPKDRKNDSCVLAQSGSDLTDWMVFTNHTTAYYRCWK